MSGLRDCCTPSCENPNALEYQKCWKSEHNTACCACCQGDEEEETRVRVVRSSATRADYLGAA